MKSEYINIQKTDYGFIINENINKTLFNKIFFIILLLFIGFVVFIVNLNISIKLVSIIIKIIILSIILLYIYYIIFISEYIKIFNEKIIFITKIKTLNYNKIELKKINIKEISINYEIEISENFGEVYIYNLDFIDNDFNGYRIVQSRDYDLIFNYGIKLEKLLNIKLSDNKNIEGYGNIFNKRIV